MTKTITCIDCGEKEEAQSILKLYCRPCAHKRKLEAARKKDADYKARGIFQNIRRPIYNRYREKYPMKEIVWAAKARAREKGLEFDLVFEDIVVPETCPVLGIPIIVQRNTGSRRSTDNSPSVDRIDNNRGYTKDNICVISKRANTIKNSANISEIEMILAYMKRESINKQNKENPDA